MRSVRAEILSGIMIFVGIAALVVGFLYLKNVTFRMDRYAVTIEFEDVTGLEPSDFVSVAGHRIGRVTDLRLNPSNLKVLVEIELNPEIKLPKDSQAQIKALGMVGEKFVDIIPGKSTDLLGSGEVLRGSMAGDLSDISGSMEGFLLEAERFLDELRNVIQTVFDQATQKDLKESLFHLNRISSTLDRNTDHFQTTLTNLEDISTNLNEILTERRSKVETSIDNFQELSTRLGDITAKIDSSLTSVNSILVKIEQQEGALGKVIYEDELYNEVRHLTAELDSLVIDLKKRPQKYLNLGFIKVF